MSVSNSFKYSLMAAAVGASLISVPCAAQTAGPMRSGGSFAPYRGEEQVIIQAPSYYQGPRRGILGAPVRTYSISAPVRYDDLNLRTNRGAHRLLVRVEYRARQLCRRLNWRYPVSYPGPTNCYDMAVAGAMDQADAAIDRARGSRRNEY